MASGEMSTEAFRSFLADTLGACARVSRDGAVHFVCIDWRHMDDVSAVGDKIYGELLNLCVWNKSNAGMGSLYRSKHELVFVYKVGATGSPPGTWRRSSALLAMLARCAGRAEPANDRRARSRRGQHRLRQAAGVDPVS